MATRLFIICGNEVGLPPLRKCIWDLLSFETKKYYHALFELTAEILAVFCQTFEDFTWK